MITNYLNIFFIEIQTTSTELSHYSPESKKTHTSKI